MPRSSEPHHVAALVHLGDQPVGVVAVVELDRPLGPRLRRGALQAAVGDHLGLPVLRRPGQRHAGHDDAAFVGVLAAGDRRVDRHHHPVEGGRAAAAPPRSSPRSRARPRPSGTNSPSSSCRPRLVPPYFAVTTSRKPGRQMHPVRRGRRLGHHGARRVDQRSSSVALRAASSSPPPAAGGRGAARTAACPRPPRPSSTCRARRTRRSRTAARAGSPGRWRRKSAPPRRSARPAGAAGLPLAAGGPAASRRGCRKGRRPSPPAPRRASRRPGRPGNVVPGSPGLPPFDLRRESIRHPARVLPAPRPPRMTQVVQSPSGGS